MGKRQFALSALGFVQAMGLGSNVNAQFSDEFCQAELPLTCRDEGCQNVNAPGRTCLVVPGTQEDGTQIDGCFCHDPNEPLPQCAPVTDPTGPLCVDFDCAQNNPALHCDPLTCRCVPTVVEVFDHYKCWQVKDLKNPKFDKRVVTLNDQFAVESVEVKKLFLLCAPADKDGSGINDPNTHQCCYKIKGTKLSARVEVVDQFGTHTLEVKKAKFLCQPCSKTVLP